MWQSHAALFRAVTCVFLSLEPPEEGPTPRDRGRHGRGLRIWFTAASAPPLPSRLRLLRHAAWPGSVCFSWRSRVSYLSSRGSDASAALCMEQQEGELRECPTVTMRRPQPTTWS